MTAELAVTFPVVVLALAVVLLAGSLARTGVTCVDAARAAGRAVARGETAAAAAAEAQQVAGRPAAVQVSGGGGTGAGAGAASSGGGGLVVVDVRLDVVPAVVPSWVDPGSWRLPVSCSARAWAEPAG